MDPRGHPGVDYVLPEEDDMKNMRWGILKPATDQQRMLVLFLARSPEGVQNLWTSICSRVYYGLEE